MRSGPAENRTSDEVSVTCVLLLSHVADFKVNYRDLRPFVRAKTCYTLSQAFGRAGIAAQMAEW